MNLFACPCGTQQLYLNCCGRFISQQQIPSTPEELMRSRYTAWHQRNVDYIARTMQGPAAIGFDPVSAREWAQQITFTQLHVIGSSQEGDSGIVEFNAHYTQKGLSQVMHETSTFRRIDGHWYYTDQLTPPKKQKRK